MPPSDGGFVATLIDALGPITDLNARFVVAYGIVVPTESIGAPGMPTCAATTPPTTKSDAEKALATAQTYMVLPVPVSQIETTMDPQAWSQGCASSVFPDTHIAHKTGLLYNVDPSTCVAQADPPFPIGSAWNADLYEKFVPMTYSDAFLKNIITITTFETPSSYFMQYNLNKSLQGQMEGDPPLRCGTAALYKDDGFILGYALGGNSSLLAVWKEVMYSDNFEPKHHAADLASDAAAGLHLFLDSAPFMVCCPSTP